MIHTCAIAANGLLLGLGGEGALGYADLADLGYDELPGSWGPVPL